MTCRDVIEFLADYLSEELPAAQRAEFDAHVAGCEACTAYIKSYERALVLGKAAFEEPDGEVPEEVPDELVEAILAARKRKS
jgi:anti-sigma factor RsiW